MHFLEIYWNKGFFCTMKLITRLREIYHTELKGSLQSILVKTLLFKFSRKFKKKNESTNQSSSTIM